MDRATSAGRPSPTSGVRLVNFTEVLRLARRVQKETCRDCQLPELVHGSPCPDSYTSREQRLKRCCGSPESGEYCQSPTLSRILRGSRAREIFPPEIRAAYMGDAPNDDLLPEPELDAALELILCSLWGYNYG